MDDVRSPRMPDRVRRRIRVKHYSLHTEQAYVDRIRRFVLRHGKRPPPSLARGHVEASSLLPGGRPLGRRFDAEPGEARAAVPRSRGAGHRAHAARRAGRAKASVRPPAVPTHDEVARVLVRMRGTHRLPGRFPHGTGMRIMEGVLMRVKNIEFARRKILVRDGNGARDRVTMPPRGTGVAAAQPPERRPGAATALAWQCVFPADQHPWLAALARLAHTHARGLHARPRPRRARRGEPARPALMRRAAARAPSRGRGVADVTPCRGAAAPGARSAPPKGPPARPPARWGRAHPTRARPSGTARTAAWRDRRR